MATQVLVAHTGQRLQVDASQFSSLDDLKTWLSRQTAIAAQHIVALTSQGRSVKFHTLHAEKEICVYDIRMSQTQPSGAAILPPPELPLPKQYVVPVAPNSITDINAVSAWQELFKHRRTWAMKLVEDSASMHSTIEERYGEMDVMTKCLDAAISNVELSVKQIEPRYAELKNWLGPALAEHEQLVNNMEQYLTTARNVPISAAMVKFMTSRDIAPEKQATLEDLIEMDTARKAGRLAPTALRKFASKATDLDGSANMMYQRLGSLIQDFEKFVGRSTFQHSGESAQLLQEIEAVAKKIDVDYQTTLSYSTSQRDVLQASKTASNHTERLVPGLKKNAKEMDDMLQYSTRARNTVTADSVGFMRAVSDITSLHTTVKMQINALSNSEEDMTTFDYLRLIHQLPYMYASFLVEGIKRREWAEKVKTDTANLANAMALFQDEESKRRRKWQKTVGSTYALDKFDTNILEFEVNLMGENDIWPNVTKQDLVGLIENLEKQNADRAVIDDISKLLADLSAPTRQQTKRIKAFKNGSIHEASLGISGLLIRGDDDLLRSLQDNKTKLESKLKTAESRVRRLEDLLHRQGHQSRPSVGNVFQTPSQQLLERPDGSTSSRVRRPSEGKWQPAESSDVLLQRIAQLEQELNTEKDRSATFEKDLNARMTQHDAMKGRMEEVNSTKNDLMENMEALKKEFVEERKSLETEIKRLQATFDDTEDHMERFAESREHEKAAYEQKLQELEDEIERLQRERDDGSLKAHGQVEFLRKESRLQREQNEALELQIQQTKEENKSMAKRIDAAESTIGLQLRHLQDIFTQLVPETPAPEDLNYLLESLASTVADTIVKLQTMESDTSLLRSELEIALGNVSKLRAEGSETSQRLADEEQSAMQLRETLSEEKARAAALEGELAEGREQLSVLRAQLSDGETGSESLRMQLGDREHKITILTEDLASRQSQVGCLEEEVVLYKNRLQEAQTKIAKLTTCSETRTTRAKDLTQRLYSQNDRLCRLLERLGFSVTRQSGKMTVQKLPRSERSPQLQNPNDSSDPSSSLRRSSTFSRPLADSSELESVLWMNAPDPASETEKYEHFMSGLGTFDVDLFSDTVYKRVKDIEHLARKFQRDSRSYRDKAHALQKEAHEKIAFKHFKEGDLALFLPTRNQSAGAWAAFNVGFPHYFLREQDTHRLRSREWLVARITRVQERMVDLSKSLQQPGESDSINDESADNPFQLSDGLRWYLIDAHEDKSGAPATPGLGKSTVAANHVEAVADIHAHARPSGKDKHRIPSSNIEGVSRTLSKSLESRRSSTSSRKALPFSIGGAGLLRGNAVASETSSLRATAPETPAGTSPTVIGALASSSSPTGGPRQAEINRDKDQPQAKTVDTLDATVPPTSPEARPSKLNREQSSTSAESPTRRSVVFESLWSLDLSYESPSKKKQGRT